MDDALFNIADLLIQDGEGGILLDKTTRVANVNGSLALVTGQHPHLDVGSSKLINGLGDTLLELILDGSGASEFELLLDLLADLLNLFLPVDNASARLIVCSL